MTVREIALEGFRNHKKARFAFGPGVNIICGPNGRGKTNLLEGLFLLSGTRSWRTGIRAELIGWDSPFARLTAVVFARGREHELVITLPRGGPMTATANGVKVGRQNPLSDVFRGVLFSPDDLMLIKGPPSVRRDFIDAALAQLLPRYGPLLGRYHRLLASKGRLLRQGREDARALATLPEYNAQLAAYGAALLARRAAFCRDLAPIAARVQQEISQGGEALELTYQTVSSVADPQADEKTLGLWLAEHLENRREAEIAAGMCLSGVHRDTLHITLGGRPARAFASQGQARSAALALRFAQRALFEADLGEHPVLLLDDVLSELDDVRRAYVCRGALCGQAILTCCQREPGFDAASVIML